MTKAEIPKYLDKCAVCTQASLTDNECKADPWTFQITNFLVKVA